MTVTIALLLTGLLVIAGYKSGAFSRLGGAISGTYTVNGPRS